MLYLLTKPIHYYNKKYLKYIYGMSILLTFLLVKYQEEVVMKMFFKLFAKVAVSFFLIQIWKKKMVLYGQRIVNPKPVTCLVIIFLPTGRIFLEHRRSTWQQQKISLLRLPSIYLRWYYRTPHNVFVTRYDGRTNSVL